jgi:hypothetical protein
MTIPQILHIFEENKGKYGTKIENLRFDEIPKSPDFTGYLGQFQLQHKTVAVVLQPYSLSLSSMVATVISQSLIQ